MTIDWISKLRHGLQVMAFCLVIATLQVAFQPDKPYGPPVVFSLLIGTTTWAIIDIGRELLPRDENSGWPRGIPGVLIVLLGIVVGWFVGNWVGDFLCVTLHLFPLNGPPVNKEADLRSSVLITLMAGIVGSFYFYSINKSAHLQTRMGEARKHANEARLKLLETQLEPHMLFNTLANLRALIAVDADRAQVMLDHMIAYLRSTLDASRATMHPLQAEFDRLRDYLELMSIRMGKRLAYELQLPAELAQVAVPTLLLQPIVENSIKHGLEPKREGGRIVVSARRDGADLVIEVRDTGVGPGASTASKGYGLGHVRERLATLHGDRAQFDFTSAEDGGARTFLRMPMQA